MNSILIATIAGMVTAVCWGTTDWLVSKMSKKHDRLEINLAVQIPSALMMLPIVLILGKPLPTTEQTLTLAAVGVLFTAAFLTLIKALSSGLAGVVIPLANTYALITLVLSIVFLGSVFTGMQVVAVIGIVAGAALLAYEKNHKKVPIRVLHRETLLALSAASMWGVGFFLANTVVGEISWQMLTTVTSIFITLYAFLILIYKNSGKIIHSVKSTISIKLALFVGLFAQTGAIFFYYGSERSGSVVIPAVMASTAPLIASGLAAIYDKEKIGYLRRIGAVVVVAGIIVLNLV